MIRTPRGIRNNNPFNLRHGPSAWRGLAQEQRDEAFCQFIAPEWGIRAGLILLKNYQAKYGLWTIEKMINRFAPPVENNTTAYVRAVAKEVGVPAKARVNVNDVETAYKMAVAIISHENGQQPYTRDTLMKAISLAGIQ